MSDTEPERNNFERAFSRQGSSRQIAFGKIAAIFLVVGPPTFGLLFWLAVSLANPVGDPLHDKFGQAFGIALSFFGLLASYVVGLLPSLIAAFGCSKSRRITGLGLRLLVTALIGAAIYLLLFSLFLPGLTGRNKHDWLLFTGYAAGAGAISTFFCALIVEYFSGVATPPRSDATLIGRDG
jgi:uncharacterized membrane protein YeaQ/YmgE (transglycosylase-associated protein family)